MHIFLLVFVVLLNTIAPMSFAMEAGRTPSEGKQEVEEPMEIEPALRKGKRKAKKPEPAEAQKKIKKEKTKGHALFCTITIRSRKFTLGNYP